MISTVSQNAVPPEAKKAKNVIDGATEEEQVLLCKRLSEAARLPTRGSAEAAGYDLYR